MADNEELETVAYTRYQVDCPACGDVWDLESDPSGEVWTCAECSALVRVTETR